MKTLTTFRSDEEYWAWIEKQVRWRDRLYKAARYAALMASATLLLFALLYFCVRHMGTGRYDQWSEAINSVRLQGG